MDSNVTIHDWMLDLGLTCSELMAFAVICSFGQDGKWFQGSASYLGKWMGVTRKHTIYDALSALVKKGLLEKRERWDKGQKLCDYRPVRETHQGSAKSAQGGGAKTVLHNNRPDSNRDNLKEIKNKESFVHQSLDDFINGIR